RHSAAASETQLRAVQAAGVNVASAHGVRKKSLLAALFHLDEEEDDPGIAASGTPGSRSGSFNLAAADTKPEAARAAAVPVPAARPQQVASALVGADTA